MPNKLRNLVNKLVAVLTAFFSPKKTSWHYRMVTWACGGNTREMPKTLPEYWLVSFPASIFFMITASILLLCGLVIFVMYWVIESPIILYEIIDQWVIKWSTKIGDRISIPLVVRDE